MVTGSPDGAPLPPSDPPDRGPADGHDPANPVPAGPRARIRRLLDARPARRLPDGDADRRAAVVLTLRPAAGPDDLRSLETLIVRRAERASDPWSGHASLPGGHREPGDPDLVAAGLRELREETGLSLPREAVLGRLDDIHPRSRRLPSVAVTPLVAWHAGDAQVEAGPEVDGHLWTPLRTLQDPERSSVLTFRRDDAIRAFPTVEVGGLTVWGLTLVIFRRFLGLLPEEEFERPGGRGEEPAGQSPDGSAPP